MRAWHRKALIQLTALSAGGSVLVLEGCDAQVRDTVLAGAQGATQTLFQTFVQAFFESLTPKQDDTTTGTVKVFGEDTFIAA